MIESIISSKTRIKLLLKFFLNDGTESYLRGLETEFGGSSNGIRVELNRLVKAGMLKTFSSGNKRMYKANVLHPLYENVRGIVRKHVGLDRVIDNVIRKLGDVDQAYLAGAFSKGVDDKVIDIILVGNVDRSYLTKLVELAEGMIERKIRYLVYSREEVLNGVLDNFSPTPLLLWDKDQEA